MGHLCLDRSQALAQFSDIVEALYVDPDRLETRFDLVAKRAKALLHLLLNRIDTLVDSVKALVDSVKASVDSVKARSDVRQALAYV